MDGQKQFKEIKNKDILLIQEVRYLKMDIISLEDRLHWERERRKNISQSLSMAVGGGPKMGMDDAYAEISEMEKKHATLVKRYCRAVQKAEQIIAGIQSHQLRTLVEMLYLDDLPVNVVQSTLRMNRWSFENARKMVEEAENMESVRWHDRYGKQSEK